MAIIWNQPVDVFTAYSTGSDDRYVPKLLSMTSQTMKVPSRFYDDDLNCNTMEMSSN